MSAKETAPGKLAPGTARRGALKRLDGEPLTRQDLQYDLLWYIFNDDHAVFTDPFSNPPSNKVTFRDLYVSAIQHTPKTARSARDKMAESDVFAMDFAMLSLLANVGRVNTSMAFFPETRTALRTYHPVPALQRTDGNLTDAPRIRNALKSVILPIESKLVPNSPFTILAQRDIGPIPTTSVVNLLFVLTQHSPNVGAHYFVGDAGLEFTDLFQPIPIPSAERGRAFLWLIYHHLESSDTPNPFADPDPSSTEPKDKAPPLHRVTPEALAHENIDTQEEKEYGEKMSEHRRQFLAADKERQDAVSAARDEDTRDASANGTPAPNTGPAPSAMSAAMASATATMTIGKPIKPKGKPGRKLAESGAVDGYTKFRYTRTSTEDLSRKPPLQEGVLPLGPPSLSNSSYTNSHHAYTHSNERHYNRHHPSVVQESVPVPAQEHAGRGRKSKRGTGMRTEPYEFVHSPERTMFQQAWHRIQDKDPVYDSDEVGDEHVRLELTRRLQTLNRLRGRSPTPDSDPALLPGHPGAEVEPTHEIQIEMDHRAVPSTEMDVDDRW